MSFRIASKWAVIIILSALCVFFTFYQYSAIRYPVGFERLRDISIMGDPQLLQIRYEKWKANASSQYFTINLVEAKQHTAEVKGALTVDGASQQLFAHLTTALNSVPLSLWLTKDAHLYPTNKPNPNLAYIGDFTVAPNGERVLTKNISDLFNRDFQIGQAIITPTNSNHLQEMQFLGSPSLFQRLYATEQWLQRRDKRVALSSYMNLLVPVAQAAEAVGFPQVFNDLVTQGEDVFFNETFNGNGRTCGTCHPAQSNFTIDPNFIASLPANDPLFVAEFLPALTFGAPENLDDQGNPRRFENPALMRAFGVIVENVDGMGDLTNRFSMRSVPHNIGMSVSVDTPPSGLTPPDDRTGWSGDGAPRGNVGGVAASGRVRDFVLGAIVQHNPKTLARSFAGDNPDFRVASIAELDATEAFLFSLGRQSDFNINAGTANELKLVDASAEAGKVLFRDGVPGGTRTCNGCHGNAGANVASTVDPGNRNFNTGIELFLQNRIMDSDFTVVGEPRPVDGGFGTNPAGTFTSLVPQPGFVNENFGNKTFNTVSLVEAADTPPFFHNNVIDNLEDAIAFYNSEEFVEENGGSIPFNTTQIRNVANFLRVVNAIDNIENAALRQSAKALVALGQTPVPNDVLARILIIMNADTEDAIEVLRQGNLHNTGGLPFNAVKQLEEAVHRVQQASNSNIARQTRINFINQARFHLTNALNLIRL